MRIVVDKINQAARFIPTWVIYILGVLVAAYFFYLGVTNALGADPIKALEHRYGEIALQLLIVGLFITPLQKIARINLIRFRRAIGLVAFFYVTIHLLVWLLLDVRILGQIWSDILKRPYITIGMVAFVLMIPLAVTSNNLSIRRLGPKWRKLHKLTHGVALLGGLHFVMLAKGFQLEPLFYLGTVVFALSLRQVPTSWRLRFA